MLTGQATLSGVTNAINKAGLYRYIAKPWETNDLVLTVKEALKSFDKDRELEYRRKQLEIANENLLKLDTAKTYFLNLLSHELNTPLIGIKSAVDILKYDIHNEELIEMLDLIAESSQRLKKFTDDSLFLTRLLTDKYEIKPSDDSICNLLKDSVRVKKDVINEKNINVEIKCSPEDIIVKFDFTLIKKCFDIIIDNAVKYSPSDSNISFRLSLENNVVKFESLDSGVGFNSKYLENSFSFFVSDEIMHHGEGFGLGLSTVNQIMRIINGKLSISNQDKGGAKVCFEFIKIS